MCNIVNEYVNKLYSIKLYYKMLVIGYIPCAVWYILVIYFILYIVISMGASQLVLEIKNSPAMQWS